MGKIYVGQTALIFEVTLNSDVTGSTCLVKYKKPNGIVGEFPATIINATTGVIRASPTSVDDLDVAGLWTFWGHVTFSDGSVAAGEPVQEQIYDEGFIPR